MVFHPFEVTIPHVAYACLGGFVVLFGMFSLFLREKLYIGEACWAFLFGVIMGPYGANVFNPRGWGNSDEVTNMITLEFTRVVLAIGVFAIGVELPKAYMARHWKSLFFLLVPVMTWGWFVSAGLIYALIPGLNFLSSLAVAACLTPTDPILAAAVVGGKYADKHVPAHIRHLLAAESGCNDGAAFPFLYLSLYLIIDAPNTGHAIRDWFLLLWLYQVILGVVIGGVIGFAFRHLMKFCERHNLIDRHSYVAQYISLAMLTIGVTTLIGSDDLLAAFACGTAFAWDGFFNRQTEESVFSSVIDLLFNVAAFVFVGAWMPFNTFQDAALTLSVWRLIVIAILVLLLRRLPIMIALYKWIPDVKTFREAIFSGHFGPIGIGAIFISTLATEILHNSDHPASEQTDLLEHTIQPVVAFMVLCSITIHGLSIPSFSLGRRVHTVSRTWSRHAPPDWTNQARLVERGGDDIIINRDSEMERGDLAPNEKLATGSSRKPPSETETAGISEKHDGDDGSLETTMEETQSEEGKDETPPDGTEVLEEWKEGHDRIIERRAGPGEEVEVEVIRNVDAPGDAQPSSSSFRSQEGAVHRHLTAYIDKLKRPPHELEQDAGKLVATIEKDVRTAEHKAKHAISPKAPAADEEEEEGWASDRSNGDQGSTSTLQLSASNTFGDRRKRSKSPKQTKTTQKLVNVAPGRRGRRRNSIRRGLVGQAQQFMHADDSQPSMTEGTTNDRGHFSTSDANDTASTSSGTDRNSRPNTGHYSPPSTAHSSRPSTGHSSLRHFRLDNIKALHSPSPREVSPSRSVRFVDDENKSGASTPRISIFQNDSSPGTPNEGLVGDDLDSARNKVTFDLPKPGKH